MKKSNVKYNSFVTSNNATKGITLIALIVTIIILLILAGISIASLTGENGILSKAIEAAKKTEEAKEQEEKDLQEIEKQLVEIAQVVDKGPGTLSGEGTEENPYLIESIEDLVEFSKEVAGGNKYTGKIVKLDLSLDFNSEKSYVDAKRKDYGDINGINGNEELIKELTTGTGFTPIGNSTNKFEGTFDGENYALVGLYISSDKERVGLFGETGTTAVLKNLTIKNGNLTNTKQYAGMLVGYNRGRVENVNINNGEINVKKFSGGIAGRNEGGTIISCRNSANLQEFEAVDTEKYVDISIGGIVGHNINNGTVENCENAGNVSTINGCISGIVGNNTGKIRKCINKGNITSTGTATENVAGIAGWNGGGTITESVNMGKIIDSYKDAGGIVGDNKNGGVVTLCTNKAAIEGNQNTGGIVGGNYTEGTKVELCENEGPVTGNRYVGGTVGYCDTATVNNCSNSGEIEANGEDQDENIYAQVGGIVGRLGYGKVTNSSNIGNITANKGMHVGGISGTTRYSSTIENCYNTGKVEGKGEGIDNGKEGQAGGISGIVYEDSTIKKCYNTGIVTAYYRAGGIVGLLGSENTKGNIENCYNIGEVIAKNNYVGGIAWVPHDGGGEIKNSYNIGKVNGTTNDQGGIAGLGNPAPEVTFTNCYYLEGTNKGAIDEEDIVGQAESRTEEQMKKPEFITELNGDNEKEEWKVDESNENQGFPILEWQVNNNGK